MNKELEIILGILIISVIPIVLGRVTNIILKIKNTNFFDTWYIGIWLTFFIVVLSVIIFSTVTKIIK